MTRGPAPSAGTLRSPEIIWVLSDVDDLGNSSTTPTSPLTAQTFTASIPLTAPFEMPKFAHDTDELVTSVSAARPGGTTVTVEDASSIDRYGRVTWRRTDVIAQTDSDVQALADRMLLTHKDVLSRVTEATIRPTFSDAAMWIACAGELNETIRLKLTAQQLDRYGYIIGMDHDISLTKDTWTCTLRITEGGQ